MELLLLLLALWTAWMVVLFLAQRKMVFIGQSIAAPERPRVPPGAEVLALLLAGGETVEAWYLPAAGAAAESPGPALIFTHGNGELVDHWIGPFRLLAMQGVAVLLVEFPGYGRSGGRPGEGSITRAMVEGYDALATRPEIDEARIVAMGRSLGGGAAAALTRHRPVAALILKSSFTGLRGFARRYLAPSFLVRDVFDNVGAVTAFEGPVLVFHGRRDNVIPYAHGEALAAAAQNGRLVTWDCAHNDCPPDWEHFMDEIVGFLREHGIKRAEPVP